MTHLPPLPHETVGSADRRTSTEAVDSQSSGKHLHRTSKPSSRAEPSESSTQLQSITNTMEYKEKVVERFCFSESTEAAELHDSQILYFVVTKEDGKLPPGTAPTGVEETFVLGNDKEGRKSSSMIFANDGSSSTSRLSVSSACLVEQAGDSIEDPFRHMKSKPTISKIQGAIPFFTASIFAPHIAQDMVELQRRLEGGYAESSSGRRYLTPSERWEELKREEGSCNWTELRPGAPLPQEFLTGAGILWAHPSIEDGLPVPLPQEAPTTDKPRRAHQSDMVREQEIIYTQLLTRVFRVLPQWERQVTVPETADMKTLENCEILFREFFLQTYEISATEPSHVRLRLMISQFYVSIRDTLVLLQDPKRYVASFSRLDRLGSMFQAEVLSLQRQDEIEGGGLMMGIPSPGGPKILSTPSTSVTGEGQPVSYSCSASPTAKDFSASRRSLQLLSAPQSGRTSRRESVSASPKLLPPETRRKSFGSVDLMSGDLPQYPTPSALSSRRGSSQSLSARKAKDLITLASSLECFPSEPGEWTGGQFQIAVDLFRRRACRILRYIIGVLKNFVFIKLLRLSSASPRPS